MRAKAVWGGAIALLVLVIAAAPAAAQDHTADVAAAIAQLNAAGVELHGACGAAKITNLVAWNLRPAFGLLRKAGGFRAVLRPDGTCESGGAETDTTREAGFAADYLIDRASFVGYDTLSDAGGSNGAHWTGPETDPGLVARNRLNVAEPLDPAPYLHTAAAPLPPAAPATPPIVVVPAAACDLGPIARSIDAIAATLAEHVRADGDAHASIAQNITDARAEARPAIEAFKALGGFTAKYVLPAIGGYLTARHFQ